MADDCNVGAVALRSIAEKRGGKGGGWEPSRLLRKLSRTWRLPRKGEGPAMPLQRSTSSFSPRPSAAKHGFRSSYPSLTSPAPCFRWLFARRGASTWSSSSSSSPSSNPRLMFERCWGVFHCLCFFGRRGEVTGFFIRICSVLWTISKFFFEQQLLESLGTLRFMNFLDWWNYWRVIDWDFFKYSYLLLEIYKDFCILKDNYDEWIMILMVIIKK